MLAALAVHLSPQDAVCPARPGHKKNQPLEVNVLCNHLDKQFNLQKYLAPNHPVCYLGGHLSFACSQGPLPAIRGQNGVILLAAVGVTPLYALGEGRICP